MHNGVFQAAAQDEPGAALFMLNSCSRDGLPGNRISYPSRIIQIPLSGETLPLLALPRLGSEGPGPAFSAELRRFISSWWQTIAFHVLWTQLPVSAVEINNRPIVMLLCHLPPNLCLSSKSVLLGTFLSCAL